MPKAAHLRCFDPEGYELVPVDTEDGEDAVIIKFDDDEEPPILAIDEAEEFAREILTMCAEMRRDSGTEQPEWAGEIVGHA